MKKVFSSRYILILLFCSGILISCGNKEGSNAENKDTVSTYMEPQPDNATVRPDTMETQVPQDSAAAKEKMK